MNEIFRRISHKVSYLMGTPQAFLIALVIVIGWLISGPIFGYSDSWQLLINTGTTIATFLMVFLIQNTQNRDAKAIHLKLDELIKSVKGARNSLVSLEELSDTDLENLEAEFKRFHDYHQKKKDKK